MNWRWYTQLPAAVTGLLGPWLSPFLAIDLINTRWRPEIDWVTDGVIAIYFVYLLAKYWVAPDPGFSERAFKRSVAGAIALGIACYLVKAIFIHWIDPESIVLESANLAWKAAYVTFFVALARAIFFLLTWLTGRPPVPPEPRRR